MKKIRNIVCMVIGFVFIITSCQGKYPQPDSLVFTVDNSSVYMDEMMYHIMLEKLQGELYASFLGGEIKDYWNIKTDNGKTMSDVAKDNALENAIRYEIFFKRANEDDYFLTEEEKKASLEKVESIIKNVPEEQLSEYGLSEEKLTQIQEKIMIASNYYNNYIDSIVDKEAIKESIEIEKYKQYDIEYIYGNRNQKDKLYLLLEKAKDDTGYSDLVKNTELKAGKLTFLKGKDTFGEEDNLEVIITSMKVGQVSDLVETVNGYYIIKLKDDTSMTEYEKAVEEAINEAVALAFEETYKDLKSEYDITVNTRVWKMEESVWLNQLLKMN